ncbi:probable 28S ribosomal protein S10, mitochondrial [Exaiptasia diaphana]|uniref:Small ribosomal subunit protein uS10m n=1 Tax=Exaiptasia diaphana TaxID=2652724 RepID=A0A913XLV0_EXADI|nr:probable 28S ribosomal protein S10, mitochondrial [Exaiptasia diaphana]KXJ11041.1 putative 28S ribosomal protein S10, mitochondrial [Exaiptasia diaphana]
MALRTVGQRFINGLTQCTTQICFQEAKSLRQTVVARHIFGSRTGFRAESFSSQAQTVGNNDLNDSSLYSLVNVKVKGNDEAVLKSYTHFVTRAANILNIDISKRILLPTRKERYTLLKSPHIYKKHRAQYEIRTHARLLQLKNLTSDTSDVFLEYIQRNLPEGVSMSVEHTALEGMPDYLQPPLEALEFLKRQANEGNQLTETS